MPPGVFHVVFAVNISSLGARSTVMNGSHFLNRHTLDKSLYAAISNAFWNDLWTNATHDDRDYTIARMLAWQVYSHITGAPLPFKGRGLYALLMFGCLYPVLRSLPIKMLGKSDAAWLKSFNPEEYRANVEALWLEEYPTRKFLASVREAMLRMTCYVVSNMSLEEFKAYSGFWQEVRSYFVAEFEARVRYNQETSGE